MTILPWSRAWERAARSFWASTTPPEHFATSAGDVLADRLATVVMDVHARLGASDDFTVMDVGAADGALLASIRERCSLIGSRSRWLAVDVREHFVPGVEGVVAHVPGPLPGTPVRGVVMAHEWLDEIPLDVVERDADGDDRIVLVDDSGAEVLGPSLRDDGACETWGVDAAATREWLVRWWPLREPGDRAEIGISRDAAWSWLTRLVASGLALAVDYGHDAAQRQDALRHGTLAGYRDGRAADPVPDGSVNITAHVAIDSCAAAVPGTSVTRQIDEVTPAALPHGATAADVQRYFDARRLRQPAGLGGFAWMRWEA